MAKIQIVLGSTRPGRVGDRVAKWVLPIAKEHPGFEVELVDLADFQLLQFDEAVSPRYNPNRQPNPAAAQWLRKIAEGDGYIFITPEYNHSFPGVLKTALDYLDFQIAKKPVALVSYGTVGGARAAEQLKLVLTECKAALVPEALALVGVQNLIDERGRFIGADDHARHTLEQILGELEWWTNTLKAGRQELAQIA